MRRLLPVALLCLFPADVPGLAAQPMIRTREAITGLVFSPDGKTIYSASQDGSLCTHDGQRGVVADFALISNAPIQALAITPNGKMLATAHSRDNKVRLWDPVHLTVTATLMGHVQLVATVAFSPDGKILASGSYDGTIRLWDVQTAKELRKIDVGNRVTGLAWSPDGKTLASAGAGCIFIAANLPVIESTQIVLWDAMTGQERKKLPCRGINVTMSPDGRTLVAGGPGAFPVKPGERPSITINQVSLRSTNRIVFYDLIADKEVTEVEGQGNALTISRDGRFVVTARGDEHHLLELRGIRLGFVDSTKAPSLWERSTGQVVKPDFRGGLTCPSALALSPDGSRLVTGDIEGAVEVADLPMPLADSPLADLDRVWVDLAGDANKAYPVALALEKDPGRSIPFLRERLKPVPRDLVRIRKLIVDLDDEEFTVREAASKELDRLGTDAEPDLRLAEKRELSTEARSRIDMLLAPLNEAAVPPNHLRALRAIFTLERVGNADAQAVLATLAAEGETLPAREARAALKRLRR